MILSCGWEALDDGWKHRASKLLDEDRISELIQAHTARHLASAQTPMAQLSIFAEAASPSMSETEVNIA